MYTELKRKTVKCRKQHQCEWCAETLAIGESAVYRVYVFDGDLAKDWMHPECSEDMKSLDSVDLESGFVPGDNPRPKRKEQNEHSD